MSNGKKKSISTYLRFYVPSTADGEQRRLIQQSIKAFFGFSMVEFSATEAPLGLTPATGNHWVCNELVDNADLCVSPAAWPFANEDVDTLVLHHILEFSSEPHEVFRDSCRIVKVGGHIVIIGINPVSLVWLRHIKAKFGDIKPEISTLSKKRVTDWCKLLGFQVVDVGYGSLWPGTTHKINEHLSRLTNYFDLPFGQYYVLIAKKTQLGMNLDLDTQETLFNRLAGIPSPVINRERT